MRPFVTLVFSSLVQLSLVIAQAPDPNAIAIQSFPAFKDQDGCSQNCLEFGVSGFLQCFTNACLCRGDRQLNGIQFLSTCATSSCNSVNDATAIVSIFTAYCAGLGSTLIQSAPSIPLTVSATGSVTTSLGTGGFTTLTKTVFATPTVQDVSQTSIITSAGVAVATTFVTPLPVVTQTSTVVGLSQSDKISLGVGLSVGVATFVLGLWSYLTKPWEKYLEARNRGRMPMTPSAALNEEHPLQTRE